MHRFLLMALTIVLSFPAYCFSFDPISLVGESKSKVEKHLGKPKSCSNTSLGETCIYKDGTEIIFDNNKAAMVSTSEPSETPRTDKIIPVAAIAGEGKQSIEKSLGKPKNCSKVKQGEKCLYLDGAVEIIYIVGKADWITIYPSNKMYSTSSLLSLGLPDTKPTVSNSNVTTWENISGLMSVSMYPGAKGMADYFYIKAKTR